MLLVSQCDQSIDKPHVLDVLDELDVLEAFLGDGLIRKGDDADADAPTNVLCQSTSGFKQYLSFTTKQSFFKTSF